MQFNPPNTHPYKKLWAILSVDAQGNEGIIAVDGPVGPMQAVTGSEIVRQHLLQAVADAHMEGVSFPGKRLVLAEFERTKTVKLEPPVAS
jgi:hypothetical protein